MSRWYSANASFLFPATKSCAAFSSKEMTGSSPAASARSPTASPSTSAGEKRPDPVSKT